MTKLSAFHVTVVGRGAEDGMAVAAAGLDEAGHVGQGGGRESGPLGGAAEFGDEVLEPGRAGDLQAADRALGDGEGVWDASGQEGEVAGPSVPLPVAALQAEPPTSVLVTDDEIVEARRRLWADYRVPSEHGAAAAYAALSSGRYVPEHGERVAVIVCGANTDSATLGT